MTLAIRQIATNELTPAQRTGIIALCESAYEEAMAPYLDDIGPGQHLLGAVDGQLVSHLMWVDRQLQVEEGPLLRTAYVELVATLPEEQGRGHATALLRAVVPRLEAYDLAALSPAVDGLYLRLGWRYWEGPLATRRDGQRHPDPEERVMVLPLARTPALPAGAGLSVEWRPGEVW